MIAPFAHLTATGFGPWGDGMARLFLEPMDLLLVIGLVLLGARANRTVCDRLRLLLPLAWLLGGLIGLRLASLLPVPGPLPLAKPLPMVSPLPLLSPEHLDSIRAALLGALGLLVALGPRLRPALPLSLAAALATFFALMAGSALAGHGGALAALLAETVAIAMLTTLLARALAPPHPRWLVIGLRVGGSWISAASLLLLGWLVHHPR